MIMDCKILLYIDIIYNINYDHKFASSPKYISCSKYEHISPETPQAKKCAYPNQILFKISIKI